MSDGSAAVVHFKDVEADETLRQAVKKGGDRLAGEFRENSRLFARRRDARRDPPKRRAAR